MKLGTKDNNLIITDTKGSSVQLDVEEVGKLIVYSRKILRQLLPGQGTHPAIPTAEIKNTSLKMDIHRTSAVLVLTRDDDEEDGYVLSREGAVVLRDGLSRVIEAIDKSSEGREIQ